MHSKAINNVIIKTFISFHNIISNIFSFFILWPNKNFLFLFYFFFHLNFFVSFYWFCAFLTIQTLTHKHMNTWAREWERGREQSINKKIHSTHKYIESLLSFLVLCVYLFLFFYFFYLTTSFEFHFVVVKHLKHWKTQQSFNVLFLKMDFKYVLKKFYEI